MDKNQRMHSLRHKLNNRTGFTLAELLLVVAIVMVLMAIAIPSIFTIQRNMRQKELDSKAEMIYMAVQNRLTALYSDGRSSVYNPTTYEDQSIKALGTYPGDYDPDGGAHINTDSLYYFVSGSTADRIIVTEDVVDKELREVGHWVVELLPYAYREDEAAPKQLTAATVYAVYYSEGDTDVSEAYAISGGGPTHNDYYKLLRNEKNRKSKGAKVGYYGGAAISGGAGTVDLAIKKIEINSDAEVMDATVVCKKPATVSAALKFQFDLSDDQNHKYTVYYDEASGGFTREDGFVYKDDNIDVNIVGVNYTFNIKLDDLSSEKTRFTNLYGAGSGHGQGQELVPGTQITLDVTVSCPKDETVTRAMASAKGNSLYAYVPEGDAHTAYIKCGRHLQNLDADAYADAEINAAQQIATIDFGSDSEWQEAYKEQYVYGSVNYKKLNASGKTDAKAPNFKPIENDHLTAYSGRYTTVGSGGEAIDSCYSIDGLVSGTEGSAGLFESLGATEITLSDMTLTGAQIHANGVAGGLVGEVVAGEKVTITDCKVVLDKQNGDIPKAITDAMKAESLRFITGSAAGGLVGRNQGTLEIKNSAAATVLGDTCAGGLVGQNKGNLNVQTSYSDCYLYGSMAGGLVGDNAGTVNIASCYSAGYIGLKDKNSKGAGLVCGPAATVQHTYTIISCYGQTASRDGGLDRDGGKIDAVDKGYYYSTATSIQNTDHVYYFNGGVSDEYDVKETKLINDMTTNELAEALGTDDFEINTVGTEAYMLMGQSLTTYTYPRLKAISHWGDWETEFQDGALVYFEKYEREDGSIYYGFDGAGVTTSLTKEDKILGDGYGVAIREGSSTSDVLVVSVDGVAAQEIQTRQGTEGVDYYKVVRTENNSTVTYRIYPLSKVITNPTQPVAGFYNRVRINSKAGSEDTASYFDYNPHFARTVVDLLHADDPVSKIPDTISIRSPRHLYQLSLHYDQGYREIIGNRTYGQERNIIYSSYDWVNFANTADTVYEQPPIGADGAHGFTAIYDGGCYEITDISFVTESGNFVGMFGYADGVIKNVVLATNYQEGRYNYHIQRTQPAKVNETVYFGTLAGYNHGQIRNCAVAGYYLSGSDGTIYGYANSEVYAGGLAGVNDGVIVDSEADGSRMNISTYRSTCLAGGFTGSNMGVIRNSYALNHITATAQGGSTIIAGFAGDNTGSIAQSYCATALTAAGDGTESYGFTPKSGGIVSSSYYLNAGSYEFVDGLYAYDNDAAATLAAPKTYELLKALNTTPAVYAGYHAHTAETQYPYRAVVQNQNGQFVHYGDWQKAPKLGDLGIFYWEYESGGENPGYKITYMGTSEGERRYQTTLCHAHDDGGIVTDYGYGYYVRHGEESMVTYSVDGLALNGRGSAMKDAAIVNQQAKASLESQIQNYSFYPFTTTTNTQGDYIYLSAQSNKTGTWKLVYNGANVYSYELTPFFANTMYRTGTQESAYEIRSAAQLQYLNWNSYKKSACEWLNPNDSTTEQNNKWGKFTYLGYVANSKKGSQNKVMVNQTHDVDAQSGSFTPIGSLCDRGSEILNIFNTTAKVYAAYFNGTYDGQSYTIKNVNINSPSQCVGLFGITISANVSNVILYSENDDTIQTSTDDCKGWYCLGGMFGTAMLGNSSTGGSAVIRNCTISGYNIMDVRNDHGMGGTNIGGFAGLANVPMEGCSSVNDIVIDFTYSNVLDTFTNNRIGGMVGNYRGNVLSECYSGGSISCNKNSGLIFKIKIHFGGIVGGWNVRESGNLDGSEGLFGRLTSVPQIKNCYTTIDFSNLKGSAVQTVCPIASTCGESGASFKVNNCYYYTENAITYKNQAVDKAVTSAAKVTYDQLTGASKLTEGSYTGKDIYTALNSDGVKWYPVTTTDKSGGRVDGKYSFPGSISYLDGKNYPFPTIVTQPDLIFGGEPIHVHYGAWPVPDAYWQKGTASMNIFNEMSEEADEDDQYFAYGSYKFVPNGDARLNNVTLTEADFEVSEPSIAEVVECKKVTNGTYTVKVKALKKGAVTITEKHTKASFDLELTAKLKATAEPEQIEDLGNNQKADLVLTVKGTRKEEPIDYSIHKNMTWKVMPSTTYSEDGDVGVALKSKLAKEKNIYVVTGYGYDAVLTVTATYNYNGEDYTATTLVTVAKPEEAPENTDDPELQTIPESETELESESETEAELETESESESETETESESETESEVPETYKITLMNGSDLYTRADLSNGATEISGYRAPERSNSDWVLQGWYTSADEHSEMVIDADGRVVPSVKGYSDELGLDLEGDITLYAGWMREADVYEMAEALEPGEDYIFAGFVKEDVVAFGLADPDNGKLTDEEKAVMATDSDADHMHIEYVAYDKATQTITDVPKIFVWRYLKEQPVQTSLYNSGYGAYLTLTDDGDGFDLVESALSQPTLGFIYDKQERNLMAVNAKGVPVYLGFSYNPNTGDIRFTMNKQTQSNLYIFKRTTKAQYDFGDEWVSLTLLDGTYGYTSWIQIKHKAIINWQVPYQEPKDADAELLGWCLTGKDDIILNADGTLTTKDIPGYVYQGQWIYNGGDLVLKAIWKVKETEASVPGTEKQPETEKVPGTENVPETEEVPGTESVPETEEVPGTEDMPETEAVPGIEIETEAETETYVEAEVETEAETEEEI